MMGRVALAIGLLVAVTACGPDEKSEPQPNITVTVETGVRRGDTCTTNSAVGKTNTGQLVVCARHRGLDYDTWDLG